MARIQDGTNLNHSNILIVDPNGHAPFTTIADAITAAVDMALTNPTIFIRAGTYTEDLTLVDGVNLQGDDRYTCIIDGSHTVPAAGQIQISNLKLAQTTPATNLFVEGAAGTCAIDIIDCIFNIDSGIAFNLPTSTGPISITGCSDISTANSIIDNTTGASTLTINESIIGSGVGPALIAGTTSLKNSTIGTAITLSGTATATVNTSRIAGGIILSDTATIELFNSDITSGAAAAVDIGATSTATLSNVVINSAAANAIIGLGACVFGEVTYLGTSTNTVTTKTYTTKAETGELQLDAANTGNVYLNAGLLTAQALTDGQLQIGSTGAAPTAATITAGPGITITNAAGSITTAQTAGFPFTFTTIDADGALVINTAYINTKVAALSVSLPATSSVGDVIILKGSGAGGWTVTQAANQYIYIGSLSSTVGIAGSIASTNATDSVSLVCVEADRGWSSFSVVGNITVV